GADVSVHGPRGTESETVQGDDTEVHKVKVGGWAQDRYQNRSENLWEANARQVAEVVDSGVKRVAAQVVVVTGDVRARTALVDSLGEHARSLVVQLEGGTRHEGGDEEKLRAEVEEAVARVAADQDQAVLDRFGEARGRAASGVGDVLAVAGLSDTVGALRAAAVETLLIVDDPSSNAMGWIGPEPVHIALTAEELTELGVRDPVQDRLDAALVRAGPRRRTRIRRRVRPRRKCPARVGRRGRTVPAWTRSRIGRRWTASRTSGPRAGTPPAPTASTAPAPGPPRRPHPPREPTPRPPTPPYPPPPPQRTPPPTATTTPPPPPAPTIP